MQQRIYINRSHAISSMPWHSEYYPHFIIFSFFSWHQCKNCNAVEINVYEDVYVYIHTYPNAMCVDIYILEILNRCFMSEWIWWKDNS